MIEDIWTSRWRGVNMVKYNKSELFVKNGVGYISLGNVKAGKLKLTDGTIFTIGSLEELFDLDLSEEDKNLMGQMQIAK
jgi:hypothetical protein